MADKYHTILFGIEVLTILGLLTVLSLISPSKMILGAVLVLAAFIFPTPYRESTKTKSEAAKIKVAKISLDVRGGTRFICAIGGLLLLVSALYDGTVKFKSQTAKAGEVYNVPDEKDLNSKEKK